MIYRVNFTSPIFFSFFITSPIVFSLFNTLAPLVANLLILRQNKEEK